jgi:hypothetical protein
VQPNVDQQAVQPNVQLAAPPNIQQAAQPNVQQAALLNDPQIHLNGQQAQPHVAPAVGLALEVTIALLLIHYFASSIAIFCFAIFYTQARFS